MRFKPIIYLAAALFFLFVGSVFSIAVVEPSRDSRCIWKLQYGTTTELGNTAGDGSRYRSETLPSPSGPWMYATGVPGCENYAIKKYIFRGLAIAGLILSVLAGGLAWRSWKRE